MELDGGEGTAMSELCSDGDGGDDKVQQPQKEEGRHGLDLGFTFLVN